MNREDFVHAVKMVVYKGAAKGTIDLLTKPPGKRPALELQKLGQWFQSLRPEDRNAVIQVADLAANQATYNFLLILDGLLAVEGSGAKGQLELIYDDGKMRLSLNGKGAEELSMLFKDES